MTNMSLTEALASGTSLRPENIGDSITGTITKVEVKSYTDYQSAKPDFWDDGTPKTQIVVSLKTSDTEGSVYIKNWGSQRTNLLAAIKNTGLDPDKALAPGNGFTVTFVKEEPNQKNPRFNATKIYDYVIEPRANLEGALTAPSMDPAQAPVPAPVLGAGHDPWATTPPPASTSAPAPAPASAPANSIPQLIQAGLDDTQIAQITGLDPAVVKTLRTNQ